MTDNRTTELRDKLTERGVDWLDESNGYADVTTFIANGAKWTVISKSYLNPEHDWMTLRAEHITPEQAIAATLGNGTLTAEQVREAIERHSAWVIGNNRCFHDGAYEKIADELNAERHVETCRITASSTDGLCSDNPRHYFELSCGHSFTINGLDAPVACAVCGKVVKNAD